jgi:hypothetical protein
MSLRWLRLWSCVLLVAFPASLMASDSVGLLASTGTVLVDGYPSTASTAIFAGDEIQTGNSARATLTTRAMSLSLAPNSTLRIASGSFEIGVGTLVVTASDSSLRVNGTRIATESGKSGKFLVQRDHANLKIVALAGNVLVGEGQQQTTVPATKGVNIGADKNDQDTTQNSGTNAGNTLPKTTHWLSNADIGILIAVAAAVTAGVTLGIVNSRNASPSVP